ncbi:ParB/RepB/Spo0J family partition protein [Virgibacillus alimentarius]|uniref:ParB family chromosome partitioning protein n=1 Tax=Virgibacillus alimentarius TaxID=698769 RepID=A0ABS4S843_9BACI|nr:MULTISPECIES: ParB/RepB/Spo0J family partition protein [Virgibacillus]MBP2257059.1 ParB family chromosome partitioning protein [Virgibacillus alimentarius]HLR68771.1 ParB/RepB/Spo0J family partition protein [Virgibacillus sp.]
MAKGLGKGINAFFPDLEAEDHDSIQEIAINKCRPNPYQPRKTFHADSIEELKESILEYGIIQPLIVRESIKGYEIVVGERRFRAAKEAGLDTIPVIIKELSDEKMMELALLENLQREDLTPIEEAQAYANLMNELKVTQEELSKRLGKSRSHIANIVRLLTLPEQVIAYINNGELSMGHGRALLGLKEKDKVIPFVNKIRNEKLNVRQVEKLVIRLNEKPKAVKKANKDKKDIFIQERESVLRDRLGTSVNIQRGKRKGKIEIEFYTDDDLDRIINVLEH